MCDACLKVDGEGSSTISGVQVGALTDGDGRFCNGDVAVATVCLRGGVQKKCVNKVNQWSQVVPMVEVNGDPRGADFFFVFWTIFMAKNGLKML